MNNILMNACGILIDIHEKELASEEKISFFIGCLNFQTIYEKYNAVSFFLRRMELGFEKESYVGFRNAVICKKFHVKL